MCISTKDISTIKKYSVYIKVELFKKENEKAFFAAVIALFLGFLPQYFFSPDSLINTDYVDGRIPPIVLFCSVG